MSAAVILQYRNPKRKRHQQRNDRDNIEFVFSVFCPLELKSFSKFSVRIFGEKSSDFVQGVEPTKIANQAVFMLK